MGSWGFGLGTLLSLHGHEAHLWVHPQLTRYGGQTSCSAWGSAHLGVRVYTTLTTGIHYVDQVSLKPASTAGIRGVCQHAWLFGSFQLGF